MRKRKEKGFWSSILSIGLAILAIGFMRGFKNDDFK